MSYFPSPDTDHFRSVMAHHDSFSALRLAPTTTTPQDTPHSSDYMSAAPAHSLHDSPPVTWSEEPRGLGLLGLPATSDSYRPVTSCDTPSSSMPFSWHSDFVPASQPPSDYQLSHRRDSWSESCDPNSTLLPSGGWHGPAHHGVPPFHVENDPSPEHSEYTTSSQPSSSSSPYAHSDTFVRTAGSPMVKLEDQTELQSTRLHYYNSSHRFEDSRLVNPGDLITHRSSSFEPSFAPHTLPSSREDLLDVKPSPARLSRQRTYSREDIRSSVLEERQKRGFTRPENASCSCDVCGKLFQRSYNLKAHMETHDPHRYQPHACQYAGCDKRFVRRTDLLRHEQSVHVKARNHPCHLCASSFARKDTLRRHVDDGCPKRAEVKKRTSRTTRRSSVASSLRQSSFQQLRDTTLPPSPLRLPIALH